MTKIAAATVMIVAARRARTMGRAHVLGRSVCSITKANRRAVVIVIRIKAGVPIAWPKRRTSKEAARKRRRKSVAPVRFDGWPSSKSRLYSSEPRQYGRS